MITTVKHGNRAFSAHCTRCECEFIYELDDLIRDYTGSGEYVLCPNCQGKVRHPVFYKERSK